MFGLAPSKVATMDPELAEEMLLRLCLKNNTDLPHQLVGRRPLEAEDIPMPALEVCHLMHMLHWTSRIPAQTHHMYRSVQEPDDEPPPQAAHAAGPSHAPAAVSHFPTSANCITLSTSSSILYRPPSDNILFCAGRCEHCTCTTCRYTRPLSCIYHGNAASDARTYFPSFSPY